MIRREELAKDTLAKDGLRPVKSDEDKAGMEIARELEI
jgi:hypothetical protein